MKRYFAIGAALLSLSRLALCSDIDVPRITVYGTATTEIVPDATNWTLQVITIGKQLPALAEEQARNVAAVLKFLKEASIKQDTVQTSNMTLGDNKEYRNGGYVKDGYLATTTFSFEMTDLQRYRDLWIGLAQLIGVRIDRVEYRSSKRIAMQNETRDKALQAAREKAQSMADSLGSRIGEPLFITEESYSNTYENRIGNASFIDADEGGADKTILALGRIPVTIRVSVVFRLLSGA